jgi:ferritin-like metal-binding protein YciE
MKVATLQDVLIDELRDLLDAEKQLTRALPKMAKWSSDSELENAFREHLEVTKNQVQRLEQVFGMFDTRPRSKPCAGMKGLVEEGQEIAQEDFSEGMRDAELLTAGRKVEHYEIAGYTAAIELARQVGMRDAAELLQQTLREEMDTEKKLSVISKRLVKEASRMQPQQEEQSTEPRGRASRAQSRTKPRARAAGQQVSEGGERQGGRAAQRGGQSRAESRGGRTPRNRAQARQAGLTGRNVKDEPPARRRGGGGHVMIDHDEIRRWAEERGAHPACVRGTGGEGDTGMIRLDFPGFTGEQSLQPISWDEWFDKFDKNNLALVAQDLTAKGEKSNFNKIVGRETVEARERRSRAPKVKRAGG